MEITVQRLSGAEKYLNVKDGDLSVSIFDGSQESIEMRMDLLTNTQVDNLANYVNDLSLAHETPQFIKYCGQVMDAIDKRTGKPAMEYVAIKHWGMSPRWLVGQKLTLADRKGVASGFFCCCDCVHRYEGRKIILTDPVSHKSRMGWCGNT